MPPSRTSRTEQREKSKSRRHAPTSTRKKTTTSSKRKKRERSQSPQPERRVPEHDAPQIPLPILQKLSRAFNKAQKTKLSHKKAVQTLESIRTQFTKESDFLYALLGYFKKILVIPKGNDAAVERLIEMITNFTKEHPSMALELVDLVLQYNNATEAHVRFRVCQVVSYMFDTLPETEVDDEFFNKMTDCLLERARDKDKHVRAMAMTALHRLQSEDRVVAEYTRCLDHDIADTVRCAAIKAIKCTPETFETILRRSCDTHSTVRETIFKRLEKVSVKKLPCSMLVMALEKGLVDLNSSVQNACKSLLRHWLSRRGDTIPELIRYFSPRKHPAICEKVIRVLLDMLLEEKKFDRSQLWSCITLDAYVEYAESLRARLSGGDQSESVRGTKLRLETAFYWRVCLDYFVGRADKNGNPVIDVDKHFLFENTMDFLGLLPTYQTDPNNMDAARQLQLMIKYYDFADPTLLENAVANIKHALTYIFGEGGELVPEYIEGLEHCVFDEDELRDIILKVVEDLRDKALEYSPDVIDLRMREIREVYAQLDEQYQKVKQDTLQLRDELRGAGIDPKGSDKFNSFFEVFVNLKQQREDLKSQQREYKSKHRVGFDHEDYIHLMVRVGSIISCYLKNPRHRDQIEYLKSLLDNVVVPQVQGTARKSGWNHCFITILSQFAALDVTVAREYLPLYVRMLGEEEDVDACAEWIKGVSDMIVSHGVQRLEQGNEQLAPVEAKIVDLIMWFSSMACTEGKLRQIATQALLQLCLKDRLSAQSRMMILTQFASVIHFQDLSEVYFQQLTRSFFKAYSSRENYMENLIMVVIPILRRSTTFTKETLVPIDTKTYSKSLPDYVFRLINPAQLLKEPTKEFTVKFLYTRLLLLIVMELELLGMKSALTAQLVKFLHPLLEFSMCENTKEHHLYDYVYHAVKVMERHHPVIRKPDQKFIDSFKKELLQILKEFGAENVAAAGDTRDQAETGEADEEQMRDEGEEDGEDEPTTRSSSAPAINDAPFRLSGAKLNHFKDLREQVINSGTAFYEELESNQVPLQQNGLVFSMGFTSGTVGRDEASTIHLPLYTVERTSDNMFPTNTTTSPISDEDEEDEGKVEHEADEEQMQDVKTERRKRRVKREDEDEMEDM